MGRDDQSDGQPQGRRAEQVAETREQILDAAERLFAIDGIEGVSLRRIGVAAGAANHFAVQYHFGDKKRLLRAIFERRLPSIEARRAKWLAEAEASGRLDDPHALIAVMTRPLIEELDADGRHSFAAFLLGMHHHGSFEARVDASDLAPLASRVGDLLLAANRGVPPELSRVRLASAFALFLDLLAALDRRCAREAVSAEVQAVLHDDAIRMAAAAFTAPAGPAAADCEKLNG